MIQIAKPMIGEEEIKAVENVMRSGMLAQGEQVREFEKEFASYIGVKNAIAVSNGTTALDLTIKAMRLRKKSEVITTPFTFIATANVAIYNGLKPVFADIDARTFNIDVDEVQKRITKNISAVIGVHLYGHPFNAAALKDICEDGNVVLIEDCAQAHGAEWNKKKVGSFTTGCFSFYPTKNMTTGEGGMITTNNDEISERLRLLRSHGDDGKYNHVELGYNCRMTDIQGAIGRVQLQRLEDFTKARIENANILNKMIMAKEITKPFKEENTRHVYHQYVIQSERRNRLKNWLSKCGIGSAIHYPKVIYGQPLYRKLEYNGKCKNAEYASQRVLSLPVHPSLTMEELEHIANTVNEFEG